MRAVALIAGVTGCLVACSSSSAPSASAPEVDASDTAQPPGQAAIAATVAITSPTGEAAWVTLADHLHVAGAALGEVTAVDWSTDHGDSGQAQGVASWSADVPVPLGRTLVTIHATGPQADASAQLVVQRNAAVEFAGPPELDPPGALAGTSTSLRVRVALTPKSQFKPGSVRLVRVAADGSDQPLIQLYDDGDVTHGDEVQGDGAFGGLLTVAEATPVLLQVRALADAPEGQSEPSAPAQLPVVAPLTDAQIDAVTSRHASAQKAFEDGLAAGKNRQDAIAAAESELQKDPDVLATGHAQGTTGLVVVWRHGLLGTLPFAEPGTRGGGDGQRKGGLTGVTEVGNHAALLLAPFQDDFKATDDTAVLAPLLQKSTCPKTDVTGPQANAAVTFELLRTIGQYGIVVMSTHGDSFEESRLQTLKIDGQDQVRAEMLGLGTNKPNAIDVLFLRGGVDKATLQKPDIQLALRMGALTMSPFDLGVTSRFFRRWTAGMNNTLVYLGACRGLRSGAIGSALLSRGAAAVIGYDGYITTGFSSTQATALFDCLLNRKGLPDGIDPSTATCFTRAVDPEKGGGTVMFPADAAVSIHGADFRNGSFEDDMNGWTGSGDARIVFSFGAYRPTDGQHMALISTGLGFTSSSGSLKQGFCIPDGVKTISFDWQFLSAEFNTYCKSTYQDTFTVQLGKTQGPSTLLFRNIDALCGKVTPAEASIPQEGDPDGAFTTGWQHADKLDVSELAGIHDVELTFSAGDVGDSIYDTVVLIDNVVFGQ